MAIMNRIMITVTGYEIAQIVKYKTMLMQVMLCADQLNHTSRVVLVFHRSVTLSLYSDAFYLFNIEMYSILLQMQIHAGYAVPHAGSGEASSRVLQELGLQRPGHPGV